MTGRALARARAGRALRHWVAIDSTVPQQRPVQHEELSGAIAGADVIACEYARAQTQVKNFFLFIVYCPRGPGPIVGIQRSVVEARWSSRASPVGRGVDRGEELFDEDDEEEAGSGQNPE